MDQDNPGTEMEITLIRRTKSIAEDPAAGQRKRDRENGRQLAQEHSAEAFMRVVQIMRTSPDEDKAMKAAIYVCNRAWGTPKAEQNEDPAITNKTMLDILEQISLTHSTVEQSERRKALEAQPVHPAAPLDLTSDYELIEADDESPVL